MAARTFGWLQRLNKHPLEGELEENVRKQETALAPTCKRPYLSASLDAKAGHTTFYVDDLRKTHESFPNFLGVSC